MIDRTRFVERFSILLDRFGRTMGEPSVKEYFEILTATLDTGEFMRASQVIFREDQFWPTPQRFIDAARGSAVDHAAIAWDGLLAAAGKGDAGAVTPVMLASLRRIGVTFRDVETASEHRLGEIGKRFRADFERDSTADRTTLPSDPLRLGAA